MAANEKLLKLSKEIKCVVDLNSDFSVKDELAVGEKSKVFNCIRLKDGKKNFAIKILYNELPDKKSIISYENEIRAINQCKNPYSIKLVGYSIVPPLGIVTEKLSGGTLTSHLEKCDLDNTTKNIIAINVLYSLKHIHEEEFIHRNLTSDNIILDSKNNPKICDFGDCRYPLESSKNRSREENPVPNWMPPEFLSQETFTDKLDIYSYGMILYQLYTNQKKPFSDISQKKLAKKIVKDGLRPELPSDMPNDLQDLIKSCWKENPNDRPSSKQIFEMFQKNKKLRFPDVDETKIEENFKKLEKDSDNMTIEQYKILIKTPLPDFVQELKKQIPTKDQHCVSLFFQQLKHLFVQNTSDEQFSYLLDASQRLITKAKNCEEFIKARLHFRLPFDREKLIDQGMDILYSIAVNCPNAFDKEFVPFIKYLMKKRPEKIILLAGEIAKKLDELTDPFPFLDSILMSWKVAIEHPKISAQFLALFYYLCRVYPSYSSQRIEVCKNLFSRFLNSKSKEAICLAYSGLSYFVGPQLAVNYKHVLKCLKDPDIQDTILSVLLKLEVIQLNEEDKETQEQIISILLSKAQESNRASLILCKLCEYDENSAAYLAENNSWLSSELPTYESTLRILLVILQRVELRKKVAMSKDLMFLLYAVCNKMSEVPMKVIMEICLSFELTPELIDLWDDSGFLQKCMNYAYNMGDERSYINCFALFHEIAFVKNIPLLQDVIDIACIAYKKYEGTHKIILNLFTNLSHIQDCAIKMEEIGVMDLIQKDLSSNDYEKQSSVLNQNIHSAQIIQSSMASPN